MFRQDGSSVIFLCFAGVQRFQRFYRIIIIASGFNDSRRSGLPIGNMSCAQLSTQQAKPGVLFHYVPINYAMISHCITIFDALIRY